MEIAADINDEQSQTSDKGGSPKLGGELWLTTLHHRKLVTNRVLSITCVFHFSLQLLLETFLAPINI